MVGFSSPALRNAMSRAFGGFATNVIAAVAPLNRIVSAWRSTRAWMGIASACVSALASGS
jgi:hypothetical protein